MVVLILGASGFLGRHIAALLDDRGHRVIRAARRPPRASRETPDRWFAVDFAHERSATDWSAALVGVDAVVNAVGILRETQGQSFEHVHVRGPRALFAACAAAGVKVIQISALGADALSPIAYFATKGRADVDLLMVVEQAVVVRPSLVFGPEGESARLFTQLAALPLVPLPGRGNQRVQPIHVEDFAAAVCMICESGPLPARIVPLAGPRAVTLRELLAALRVQMGLPPARTVAVPWTLMKAVARAGRWRRGSLLDSDTLAMLALGSTADGQVAERILGRPPRPPERFIPQPLAATTARIARLSWWLLAMRLAVGLTWIVSGIVSLGIYPIEESYGLLRRVGLTGMVAALALYGAALLDIGLGLATLLMRKRRRLWELQATVVVGYTVVISAGLPELWIHPFGPVLKNIPLLAAIGMLRALER